MLHAHVIQGITILSLLIYALTFTEGCFGPQIRSDGVGYYALLPALLIHGDPTMEAVAQAQYGGELPSYSFWRRYPPTGRYVCVYNIGVPLMMSPFFIAAHAATKAVVSQQSFQRFDYPADGYSFFYQHAAALAGMFYFLVGLAVLKRVLDRHFGPGAVLSSLLVIVLGTNVLNYMSGDTTGSHPYAFFLVALLLLAIPKWYEKPESVARSVALGVLAAMLYLVREISVLALVMVPLYGIRHLQDLRPRVRFILANGRSIAVMAVAAFVVLLPQMALWKFSTGHWWIHIRTTFADYGGGLVHWWKPQVGPVLFSFHKGLFVYFPALVLVIPGCLFLSRRAAAWAWPCVAFLCVQLYVVASYGIWWAGGAFGNRYFVETMVPAAFALAALFDRLQRPWSRGAAALFCTGCIAYSLFLMSLYYTREMSVDGMDRQAWFDFFWFRKELLLEYFR